VAWPLGAQAGFSTDADAIEEAAKSVLMLGNYVGDELIGTGSGFVAFDSQTLITNHHVIEGAQYIIASDDAGNLYELDKVYCVSESMDIAILGFKKPTALKPLAIGTGNDLKRGEPVVAIGSPIGIKNTVSIGNVSAVYMNGNQPLIQITAPISHGSSGGALFDDAGQVIGVTSGGLEGGQNLNVSVQGSVPLALYAAWDGRTYHLNNWPNETPMDFAAGEKLAANAAPAFSAQTQEDWICPTCGKENQMNFCLGCGAAKPQWQCACGQINVFKFCGFCGKNQQTLLNDLNKALALMDQGEYENAVAALEKLGRFDCGSQASQAGMNVSAERLKQSCYYQWGVQLQEAGEYAAASEKYTASNGYADAPERIYEVAYLDAQKAFDEGDYLVAAGLYMALGDYKDSYEKMYESTYQLAQSYLLVNDEDEAIKAFESLEGYKDSAERIKEAYCHKGNRLAELGVFGEAIQAYEAAGDYEAAREGLKRTHYLRAEALLVIMDYAEAIKAFKQAGDYQDAQQRVKATYYLEGEYHLSKENWEKAKAAFANAGDYQDAQSRVKATYYLEGEYHLSRENWEKAKQAFEKAGDYQDAEERLHKLNFEQGEQALANSDWHAAIKYFAACSPDDSLAREKLTQAYNHQIKAYVDAGSVSQAHACYQQGIEAGCTLEDVAVAMPGSKGHETLKVLTMAKDMGFIKK
ncbi:MAG: trypsin-like peptidase domain-containing protein, partial [Clostridia bacterium]|nr:trypsin-like peptidase domain-containing protein [Clostridia bacterium]